MSDPQNPSQTPPQNPEQGNLLKLWLYSLRHYVQMSLFSSSPANLPCSKPVIMLTLVTYVLVGLLLLGGQRSLASIVVQIGIEVGILFLITYIALKILDKPRRLMQTLSALVGVSVFISLISLLVTSALPHSNDPEKINSATLQINLLLLFWNLSVISLIFKRAFEIRTLLAGVIAFNYFLIYEFLIINIFQK